MFYYIHFSVYSHCCHLWFFVLFIIFYLCLKYKKTSNIKMHKWVEFIEIEYRLWCLDISEYGLRRWDACEMILGFLCDLSIHLLAVCGFLQESLNWITHRLLIHDSKDLMEILVIFHVSYSCSYIFKYQLGFICFS